ncbi:MAG: tetratricopeptide repeat protein [Rhodocyclaceae bacterium]|nr:tetratricopeptide repeat protein [Rhodocyclaceae bacterium]
MNRPRLIAIALAGSLGLSACSSTPPSSDTAVTLAPASPPQSTFERDSLARAQVLVKQGRHREAAEVWEILHLYRPAEPAYEISLRQSRQSADRAAAQLLDKARAARAAGNEQLAVTYYLQTLASDPERGEAANELRELERTRNRRYFLGKPTRLTLGRANDYLTKGQAAPPTAQEPDEPEPETASASASADKPSPSEHGTLEHAALLERDGEFTEALAMLTRYVKANPKDEQARQQIARTWEAFGDRALSAGRPRAALRAFERAQAYNPDAASRLDPKIDQVKRSLGQS